MLDAVVIGSGPNGLSAAVRLARAGSSVVVLEAEPEIGGGARTAELTLPGFKHDICSGAHPLGILSPWFAALPLADHGLRWIKPKASVAHPLDDEPAVILHRSLEETARGLGVDADAYRDLLTPFLHAPRDLISDALTLRVIPRRPFKLARFGLVGLRSAAGVAKSRFKGPRARALFAGCAAHSMAPLEHRLTASLGLLFLIAGHVEEWPVAAGGSASITSALASLLRSLGGEIRTGVRVRSPRDLPDARVFLFDVTPRQLAGIAEKALPEPFVKKLRRPVRSPAAFKLDWALSGPIPWKDPACLLASTVHVGGTMEDLCASESAAFNGKECARPFVLVVQQSLFDPSRAPQGKHTGYAYCHVPYGSTADAGPAIEAQIERFAPGFRDRILARHVLSPAALYEHNQSLEGGALPGGLADIEQTMLQLHPYETPNPRIFLCSASTPPGAGVHGMCGARAALIALRCLSRQACGPLA
ncbi:MAG TPA: NAD(P)/FAD-dependent oxidoreductase [Myxococcales bacterium]